MAEHESSGGAGLHFLFCKRKKLLWFQEIYVIMPSSIFILKFSFDRRSFFRTVSLKLYRILRFLRMFDAYKTRKQKSREDSGSTGLCHRKDIFSCKDFGIKRQGFGFLSETEERNV